jgi:hypothetical protein
MVFLLKSLCLITSFIGGIVIHHWVARRFFSATNDLKEKELLLHSLLVSIIINGAIGTYLSFLKIFNLYSFAAASVVAMFLLRADLMATIITAAQILRHWRQSILKGSLLTIGTTLLVAGFAAILLGLCFLPNQNPDGWAFHLPIAQSIVKNSGFVYPIIDFSLNYASQPSFVSVLFAELLLLHPHFAIAAMVNVLIYLFTFIALGAVWQNFRGAICLLLVIVGLNFNLVTGVPTVLTDMTRTCFSVLGLTYLILYHTRQIPYYAALAATCIGAAIATKYTELISLLIMGFVLLPAIKSASGRLLIFKCGVIVLIIASFWYFKNLILLKNPIYPFIFGHIGLSDEWMSWYLMEMTQAFDPAHRHLVRNLFTLQGLTDFLFVIWTWFFQGNTMAKLCLVVCVLGAAAFRRLILPMFLGTFFLFTYWYIVLFNHIRWAKPAVMLLLVTTCFVLLSAIEAISLEHKQKITRWASLSLKRYKILGLILISALSISLIFALNTTGPNLTNIPTRWTFVRAAEPLRAVFTPGGVHKYLSETREGYKIIRYVIDNDLQKVFHPFHFGVTTYAGVYNEGARGDWFVDINDVPENIVDCYDFIKNNNILHFVTLPPLSELDAGRLGLKKVKVASAIMACLERNATLILEDRNGWKLYKFHP